ncbi:hypothetical protein RFI_08292 [Reticulomyxa filosa]|uniref:Uncharacterized protein n=1 Tax=Reticulomyxa filosa TaxID=46433 RepID=X6NSU8_RETFI|nr:hypothetical protein RFI_08292 [Reticulomyxa filosa]|eukprot:ETO28834.1 hypothetical protein RFI_08292 [Reticulomyxa filosa]
MEQYDYNAHLQSLEAVPNISNVSGGHWRVPMKGLSGNYDLDIQKHGHTKKKSHLLRGFPEVTPLLRIMAGLEHGRVDSRTGEILFPQLQDTWKEGKVLIGKIVELVLEELKAEPPTIPVFLRNVEERNRRKTLQIRSLEQKAMNFHVLYFVFASECTTKKKKNVIQTVCDVQ